MKYDILMPPPECRQSRIARKYMYKFRVAKLMKNLNAEKFEQEKIEQDIQHKKDIAIPDDMELAQMISNMQINLIKCAQQNTDLDIDSAQIRIGEKNVKTKEEIMNQIAKIRLSLAADDKSVTSSQRSIYGKSSKNITISTTNTYDTNQVSNNTKQHGITEDSSMCTSYDDLFESNDTIVFNNSGIRNQICTLL